MANKFWVGGTGTWDTSTQGHWATVSNGSPTGVAPPTSADIANFDANSGSGTVTVSLGGSATFAALVCGAMTSLTLDFSVNNDSITLTSGTGFSLSGSGASRTVTFGSNVLTAVAWLCATVTGLTLTMGTSSIVLTGTSGSALAFQGGGKSYHNVTLNAARGGSIGTVSGNNSFDNLTITGGMLQLPAVGTQTINSGGSLTIGGSSATPCILSTSAAVGQTTIACGTVVPSISWTALYSTTWTASVTPTATDSFDCGTNNNITITQPSGGGGGGLLVNPGMSGGMS